MGIILFFLIAGVPLAAERALLALAKQGTLAKMVSVLGSLGLGAVVVLVGVNLAFVGIEDTEQTAAGLRAVKTTWPVAGWLGIVVGAGIALFGTISCAGAQSEQAGI